MFIKQQNPERKKVQSKQNKFLEKLDKKWKQQEDQLQGSKFRMLNEFLYTSESKSVLKHFRENPKDFELYHKGFTIQQEKWPENPMNNIIKLIEGSEQFKNQNMIICDLGCGDGKIQEYFDSHPSKNVKKVFSYDLISTKPFIIEADIANLNVADQFCDLIIYSLSLMGTNYLDFLAEGFRILRTQGFMIVAEVKSRMQKIDYFVNLIVGMGFKILKRDEHNTHFVLLVFQKQQDKCGFNGFLNQKRIKQILCATDLKFQNWQDLAAYILKPCIYKKR